MTELNILAVQNADLLRALATPDTREGLTSNKALADRLGRDNSNLGKTLKLLESGGLLKEQPLANGLTDDGLRQLEAINRAEAPAFDDAPGDLPEGLVSLVHAQIFPDHQNARQDWDSEEAQGELDALRADIVRNGLLQNLVVRAEPETGMGAVIRVETDEGERLPLYTLIGGERRWRAIGMAIAAGEWPEERPILCRLLDVDPLETRIAALAENLLRRKLNPIEKATGFQQLADLGLENKDIAGRLGFTPEHVQQHRRFLKLDDADRQRMTLPKDDPRHLSVRDARQKLSAKDNTPEPITLDPMARLAWIELTYAAFNDTRYTNLWSDVPVAAGASETPEGQRLAEIGAIEFSDLMTYGEHIGRFTAKRHYDANRTAERLEPSLPEGIMLSLDKPAQMAALRAAQVEAFGDKAPEWPEGGVAYATPWLADIGDVTPEGLALQEQRRKDDEERARETKDREARLTERNRIWAEARQRHLRLMAVAQERPEAGAPEELTAIAADLDRPLPWRLLPSGVIVAANGTTVRDMRAINYYPASDHELALGQMIVVAANAAAGQPTPPMEQPEPEPDEDEFLAAIGAEVSARQLELEAEAHAELTASILADFLSDNGVAFSEEGFDWTDEGASALVSAHYEAAANDAEAAA